MNFCSMEGFLLHDFCSMAWYSACFGLLLRKPPLWDFRADQDMVQKFAWPPEISLKFTAAQLLSAPAPQLELPRSKAAKRRLIAGLEKVVAKGWDFQDSPVFLDIDSASPHAQQGRCPCITRSRGSTGGFWLPSHGRRLGVQDMAKFQGIDLSSVDLIVIIACMLRICVSDFCVCVCRVLPFLRSALSACVCSGCDCVPCLCVLHAIACHCVLRLRAGCVLRPTCVCVPVAFCVPFTFCALVAFAFHFTHAISSRCNDPAQTFASCVCISVAFYVQRAFAFRLCSSVVRLRSGRSARCVCVLAAFAFAAFACSAFAFCVYVCTAF